MSLNVWCCLLSARLTLTLLVPVLRRRTRLFTKTGQIQHRATYEMGQADQSFDLVPRRCLASLTVHVFQRLGDRFVLIHFKWRVSLKNWMPAVELGFPQGWGLNINS